MLFARLLICVSMASIQLFMSCAGGLAKAMVVADAGSAISASVVGSGVLCAVDVLPRRRTRPLWRCVEATETAVDDVANVADADDTVCWDDTRNCSSSEYEHGWPRRTQNEHAGFWPGQRAFFRLDVLRVYGAYSPAVVACLSDAPNGLVICYGLSHPGPKSKTGREAT